MSKQNAENTGGPHAPLIFISHDSRDARLAEGFGALLRSVSAGALRSFRSSDKTGVQGIEYGIEWFPKLESALASASDVVCLLTKRSIDRPWILYEAGVARGKRDTPVHGIALGVSLSEASTGPFAQFQNCPDDIDSLTTLVVQLLTRVPGTNPLRDDIVDRVASFKQLADSVIREISGNEDASGHDNEDPAAKFFEEIKIMFRDLPRQFASEAWTPDHRRHAFSLDSIQGYVDRISEDGDSSIGILVIASILRDDTPWLYELAMNVFRSVSSADMEATKDALEKYRRASEFVAGSRILDSRGWGSPHYEALPRMYDMIQRLAQLGARPTDVGK